MNSRALRRLLKEFTATDAYFAGLIDGEGNVGFYSNGVGQRRSLCVKVNMTCRATVEALHTRFGGSFKPKKVPGKPQWMWRCKGIRAREVLKVISPHSITKRALIAGLLK